MKVLIVVVLSILTLIPPSKGWAQASASLLVTTDTSCDWKLDGVPQGRLNTDDAKVVKTTAGEHLLQATSADGQAKWQGTVTADASAQKIVRISLYSLLPTWTDPSSSLMWTTKDNGSAVNYPQASSYCKNLQLAAHSDWRLPTIAELLKLYDPAAPRPHVKGGMQLFSFIYWSSSAFDTSGNMLSLDFDLSEQFSMAADLQSERFKFGVDTYGNYRAICVRTVS